MQGQDDLGRQDAATPLPRRRHYGRILLISASALVLIAAGAAVLSRHHAAAADLLIAAAEMRSGQYTVAAGTYAKAERAWPNRQIPADVNRADELERSSEAYAAGEAALQSGSYDEAAADFSAVLPADVHYGAAHSELGKIETFLTERQDADAVAVGFLAVGDAYETLGPSQSALVAELSAAAALASGPGSQETLQAVEQALSPDASALSNMASTVSSMAQAVSALAKTPLDTSQAQGAVSDFEQMVEQDQAIASAAQKAITDLQPGGAGSAAAVTEASVAATDQSTAGSKWLAGLHATGAFLQSSASALGISLAGSSTSGGQAL